jgi:hypothetical protein
MVDIKVHNAIMFEPEKVSANVVRDYIYTGSVIITLNYFEGACCRTLGLYDLLDYVSDVFHFDKSKITIITNNVEERHDKYNIQIQNDLKWLKINCTSTLTDGYTKDSFRSKDVTKNLFGCMYNNPLWPRLCLVNYIKRNTTHSSLIACNPTFQEGLYNTVELDRLMKEAPGEFESVFETIKQLRPLPGHPGPKPEAEENHEIIKFYNDFFIDLVAETFTSGIVFSMTEKTVRPMLAMTPFITYGPTAYLSNLKHRYGFKTFSDYWDESYDQLNEYERVKKIYQLIDYLNTLTDQQRIDMYRDMMPTLEHNYNRVLELHEQR